MLLTADVADALIFAKIYAITVTTGAALSVGAAIYAIMNHNKKAAIVYGVIAVLSIFNMAEAYNCYYEVWLIGEKGVAAFSTANFSTAKGMIESGGTSTNVGEYLAGKAPKQVSPGTRYLEGQYVDDLGRVQPWKAYYDEYGRLIARTDYNAGNKTQGIPDIHYHLYEWGPGKNPLQIDGHIEGEYKP